MLVPVFFFLIIMPFIEPMILAAFLSVYFYYLCYEHKVLARFGRPDKALNFSQLAYLGVAAFCPALFIFISIFIFDPYLPSDLELHPNGIPPAPYVHHLALCLIAHVHMMLLQHLFILGHFNSPIEPSTPSDSSSQ